MTSFNPNGFIVEHVEEPKEEEEVDFIAGLSFMQRVTGALSDLADIETDGPIDHDDIATTVNFWSIDPPMVPTPEGLTVGMDQMKLFEMIRFFHAVTEEEVEDKINIVLSALEKAPQLEDMDQIDHMIYEMEHDLKATSNAVAYMTAVLNHDGKSAHDIIDEAGCSLVHVLTNWFIGWILSREVLEEGDDDFQTLKGRISEMGIENAKMDSMSFDEKREMFEEGMERFNEWRQIFDQDEGDETL